MKKILSYVLIVIFVCFAIPIIFTSNRKTKETSSEVAVNIEKEEKIESIENNYDYKNYNTIKLLHTKTNQIEEVNLDEYLYHVVSAEMPADFHIEALKAQAAVARTYTIYKIVSNQKKHGEADICDSSDCCQAWISKEDRLARWDENIRQSNWDKIVSVVNSTQGKIITYNSEPINAFFHSNSGGTTEIPLNVWGGSNYPYLQTVQTSGEEEYSQYSSEVNLTKEEFKEKIKQKYTEIQIDFNAQDCVQIKEKTQSGRVKTLKIGNIEIAGVEARTILGLRSTNFDFKIEEDKIIFKVIGYGHGVGMSQTGADALAKQGKNYEEIIKHYYTGVEIKDM
ncbi:MAG: stage II sporulation protein D [Clostridia bacterium]|jgi:stage II sporulation protein D|nr:stage II sporulation protein D [Clostridia bacterium]